jgi:hypothetical protein
MLLIAGSVSAAVDGSAANLSRKIDQPREYHAGNRAEIRIFAKTAYF